MILFVMLLKKKHHGIIITVASVLFLSFGLLTFASKNLRFAYYRLTMASADGALVSIVNSTCKDTERT